MRSATLSRPSLKMSSPLAQHPLMPQSVCLHTRDHTVALVSLSVDQCPLHGDGRCHPPADRWGLDLTSSTETAPPLPDIADDRVVSLVNVELGSG